MLDAEPEQARRFQRATPRGFLEFQSLAASRTLGIQSRDNRRNTTKNNGELIIEIVRGRHRECARRIGLCVTFHIPT